MKPKTVPASLSDLLTHLQFIARYDTSKTTQIREARSLLSSITAELAQYNKAITDADKRAITLLTAEDGALLKQLTYQENEQYYHDIKQAKDTLIYKKLTLDDELKQVDQLRNTISKNYRAMLREIKKRAGEALRLLYGYKPPKPPEAPAELIITGLWLLQRSNYATKYYTHFNATLSVKPILYRKGFKLWTIPTVDPFIYEFYGEDYPGPFPARSSSATFKHYVKYGRKGKKLYVVTGLPYFYQTYEFHICAFREDKAFAAAFTFQLEAEHPKDLPILKDKNYYTCPIEVTQWWEEVDKEEWLSRANAGEL